MRPVAVIVLDVHSQDALEVSTTEDQHAVEAFTTDGADEALSEGVGTGRPDRGPDDADAVSTEDIVEAGRELGIAIPD